MHIKLSKIDPDEHKGSKKEAKKEMFAIQERMAKVQEKLFAEHKRKLLIVLQGMDTAGKDGVINHSFDGFNPQGVRVASFKVPTQEELDHDFLWRIHKQAPAKGEIVIFNRSHYEDVLVTRVHKLIDDEEAHRRFKRIRQFEEMLVEEGTIILKFFLHISKDKQRERLQERIDDPSKNWKVSLNDAEERKYWDHYMRVYEEAINQTSTKHAPWFIVPANRKWYRNLLVAKVVLDHLEGLKIETPKPKVDVKGIVIK
jgi:PPK2 family polyphosphate:nucleotide phosphotransferase